MASLNVRSAAGGLALALLAAGALAAGLSGAAGAKDRQAHMKALGAAAKALGEQMHAGAPDKAAVKLQSDRIEAAAKALPTWFPPGSGPESGVKTRALPAIWRDAPGFAAAGQRFAQQAAKLGAAADAGDLAAVGGQMSAVGGACKGCHDKFRGPETK
ncbi:MAG TPA: cytochrome c [Caulobacteraceae bacterium]